MLVFFVIWKLHTDGVSLKILFYKNCLLFRYELGSYSRELQKSFHYTSGVHVCCFHASTPMKALLTILPNTLYYFMANVSDMYTYSLLTYPLAGFDMTLSSSLMWCQIYKWLGLHMENAIVRTWFFPSASLNYRVLYVHSGVLWLYCMNGMVHHHVEKVMCGSSYIVSGKSTSEEC